jgi:hypothetical protein
MIFYFAPFIVATADPRYRFPIDALLIFDSILCIRQMNLRGQGA